MATTDNNCDHHGLICTGKAQYGITYYGTGPDDKRTARLCHKCVGSAVKTLLSWCYSPDITVYCV